MPYRFLEDVATADIAFDVWAANLERLFMDAVDATTNVMVEVIGSVSSITRIQISLSDDELDMLLFQLLQEVVYLKDAKRIFTRLQNVNVYEIDNQWMLKGELVGEEINSQKHRLSVDVKAVTLHNFQVVKEPERYRAHVVLDI